MTLPSERTELHRLLRVQLWNRLVCWQNSNAIYWCETDRLIHPLLQFKAAGRNLPPTRKKEKSCNGDIFRPYRVAAQTAASHSPARLHGFLGVNLYQKRDGCDLFVDHLMNYKWRTLSGFDLVRASCLLNAIRPHHWDITVQSDGHRGRTPSWRATAAKDLTAWPDLSGRTSHITSTTYRNRSQHTGWVYVLDCVGQTNIRWNSPFQDKWCYKWFTWSAYLIRGFCRRRHCRAHSTRICKSCEDLCR